MLSIDGPKRDKVTGEWRKPQDEEQEDKIAVAENMEDNPSHQLAKTWTHFPEWHYISYLL
jgi:hypothetical protein